MKDRAQLHTLEGLTASIIIVLAIVYVFNSFAVVPNASSATSENAESQMQSLANDVLTQANSNGNLKEAILNWSDRSFNETNSTYYYNGRNPPGEFGDTLGKVLRDEGYSYNIVLVYGTPDGTESELTMVRHGTPSNNAVSAGTQVTLNNEDILHGNGPELENSSAHTYPIKDTAQNMVGGQDLIRLYNVVQVRITLWR